MLKNLLFKNKVINSVAVWLYGTIIGQYKTPVEIFVPGYKYYLHSGGVCTFTKNVYFNEHSLDESVYKVRILVDSLGDSRYYLTIVVRDRDGDNEKIIKDFATMPEAVAYVDKYIETEEARFK